ncbi:uncharacterized protein LOC120281026 [Dioscorea cayenensis subsp. rotundata]|uniref:Transcription repressor n=1 Tax=Dioscorea cayennensis subsp. rotundata TaxID=55577 RepID=A0AB40D0W8_DIOCR|nr:uncharacterized protein LOC120281026 [Dioscorea cayenensis subsp. rotundata]
MSKSGCHVATKGRLCDCAHKALGLSQAQRRRRSKRTLGGGGGGGGGDREGRTCPPASPASLYDNIWKEESETLLSSKSFSSDSSEFYQRSSSIANKKKNIYKHKISSSFYRQKVRKERLEENGFAVVKRSEDPYGDFKSSMVEMIVEKQIMFSEKELEKLLKSYLSLNSYHHHPVILRAFSDIWEALFVN